MPTAVVRVEDLRKSYGPIQALNGISFEVEKGKIFGLLGPNGAGKTTTIKILATLVRADGGIAEIQGIDLFKNPDGVRRLIGYVPQELTVDPYLTAEEHLRYYADLYHLPAATRVERVKKLLELVGLNGEAKRRVRSFSGGMKKKLDLACGLIHQPGIILLDEPSLGLDVPIRRDLWSYLLELKERSATLLLCTNSMEEAERLCDEVAIIDRGNLLVKGSPAALRSQLMKDVISIELAPTHGDHREEKVDTFVQALLQLSRVQGVVKEGTKVKLYVESNEAALPEVLQCAASTGLEIEALAYSRPGLDEVFFHHTGHPWTGDQKNHG